MTNQIQTPDFDGNMALSVERDFDNEGQAVLVAGETFTHAEAAIIRVSVRLALKRSQACLSDVVDVWNRGIEGFGFEPVCDCCLASKMERALPGSIDAFEYGEGFAYAIEDINVFARMHNEGQVTYHGDRRTAFIVDGENLDGYGACPELQAPRTANAIFNLLVGTLTAEKAAA